MPPESEIPDQGWKIHVSACEDRVSEMLTRVWEYCIPRGIQFKIVGSPVDIEMRSTKYADRSGSGKAVTIYPVDEAACERILAELDAELAGIPGPYILSDLRYGSGPLYVRYGGFLPRYCPGPDGSPVLAIENASGDLVPDERKPVFSVPDWVDIPEFLAPHLEARNAVKMTDLDYDVTEALHFSNGGGVYVATRKSDGRKVILKEARPHAGLAGDGSDAVSRLRREYDFMRRLSGLGIAPEAYEYFQAGDHYYLAEEFIEGPPLNSAFTRRFPLFAPDPDAGALAEYTAWALRICAAVEEAADLMHARGIVFNDLHMLNIIVRPDDTVALIDFEAAADVREKRRRTLAHPAFAAPPDREGLAADAYSLACLRLSLFLPLTTLLPMEPTRASGLAAAIASLYPVPEKFLAEAVAEIERVAPAPTRTAGTVALEFAEAAAPRGVAGIPWPSRSPESPGGWPRLSANLVATIRSSATPERTDRLFPGDIGQFLIPGGGLGLAYGAAGVLYALDSAAGVRVPEYEQWLLGRVKQPPQDMPLGCWDGLSGIAWTLGRLGHPGEALRLAEMCLAHKWEKMGNSLFSGVPGFGLALLGLADSAADPSLADSGLRAAEITADTVARAPDPEHPERAGLMHGAAGRALLLVRAYEHTGDPAYLDAAATAIRADLGQCVPDDYGGLQVDEGWRIMPYLADGGAGIGLVIGQYLAHRPDPEFADAASRIAVAASSVYVAQSGLFTGRAGLLCLMAERARTDERDRMADRRVRDHITRLAWYALPCASGTAFPGDQLLRLSMDLGTGSAGVLLGLASALAPDGAPVPLLARPSSLPDGDQIQHKPVQGVGYNRETARG